MRPVLSPSRAKFFVRFGCDCVHVVIYSSFSSFSSYSGFCLGWWFAGGRGSRASGTVFERSNYLFLIGCCSYGRLIVVPYCVFLDESEFVLGKYNEDSIFEDVVRDGYVLTPIPERLSLQWDYASNYSFTEVYDGSSLVWIDVLMDTFNEAFPDFAWLVDDPGTLYFHYDDDAVEEAAESPLNVDALQRVADVALDRYASLFERLTAVGVVVVSD